MTGKPVAIFKLTPAQVELDERLVNSGAKRDYKDDRASYEATGRTIPSTSETVIGYLADYAGTCAP